MPRQGSRVSSFLANVKEFVCKINTTISLDEIGQRFRRDEAKIRRRFRSERGHPLLEDDHVCLVDVFHADEDIRRADAVTSGPEDYLMPLPEDSELRRKTGDPCMVATLADFQHNLDAFSQGLLSQLLDWKGIYMAGGATLACLSPTPPSNRSPMTSDDLARYYQDTYPTLDIDIFLCASNEEEALEKIRYIYTVVQQYTPVQVRCKVSRNALTLYSHFPYRAVQVVLRRYSSPSEIVTDFDIDCMACIYNGCRVYATPRAIVAIMRQTNTIDLTRWGISYEYRLAKYRERGYQIHFSALERDRINRTIYRRSVKQLQGLARLLVIEKSMSDAAYIAVKHEERMAYARYNPFRIQEHGNGDFEQVIGRIRFWNVDSDEALAIQTRPDPAQLALWSAEAYADSNQLLTDGIVTHDSELVKEVLRRDDCDINSSDPQGRTPLILAIMVKAVDIATFLIDQGASITKQLHDGRNALHIASQLNLPGIVKRLLSKNRDHRLAVVPFSTEGANEDISVSDTLSEILHSEGGRSGPADGADDDILDIDLRDRENKLTALSYALYYGNEECASTLLEHGADADLVTWGMTTRLYCIKHQRSFSHEELSQHVRAVGEATRLIVDTRRGRAYYIPLGDRGGLENLVDNNFE